MVHGLRGDRRVQLPELRTLARAGLLAVGIDAAGHGSRRWSDFEERFRDGQRAAETFRAIVRETTADVTRVVDALLDRGWGAAERIGLAGVSLGGYVAYGAAVAERRLGAIVAIMGSPEWGTGPDSPHLAPDEFFPVPLLSTVAARDEVVPPEAARALHAALASRYGADPGRLRLVELADSGHMMPPEDWAATWRDAAEWFTRYLSEPRAPVE